MPLVYEYFGANGRGIDIRLALEYTGTKYENKILTFAEFGAKKDTYTYG